MKTGDRLIRVSTAVTVVGIGAVAGIISYRHVLAVATGHGETGATGRMLPLTVDGLLFTASMVLLDSARRGQRAPLLAKTALGLGIAATVAANVLHGIANGPIGAVISAWPAVTLAVAAELLMGLIRRDRAAEARAAGPVVFDVEQAPAEPVEADPFPETPPALLAWHEGRESTENGPGTPFLPAGAPFLAEDGSDAETGADDPAVAEARERFADALGSGSVPSVRALMRALRIGHPRAARVRAELEAEART